METYQEHPRDIHDFSTQPATVRISLGINPLTPTILLLFSLTESRVNLSGGNPPQTKYRLTKSFVTEISRGKGTFEDD